MKSLQDQVYQDNRYQEKASHAPLEGSSYSEQEKQHESEKDQETLHDKVYQEKFQNPLNEKAFQDSLQTKSFHEFQGKSYQESLPSISYQLPQSSQGKSLQENPIFDRSTSFKSSAPEQVDPMYYQQMEKQDVRFSQGAPYYLVPSSSQFYGSSNLFIPQHSQTPADPISDPISDPKRKKSRKTPQVTRGDDGDTELKQLAYNSTLVPLAELAARVKAAESDQNPGVHDSTGFSKENREKQRQLFGMAWLLNSCESSPTAVVPRNRIYARYVQVCADNSLSPLLPASFGKLVKILFPNLTTRRLGLRGQSKYHYCGVKLIGDQNMQQQQQQLQARGLGISTFPNQQVQSPISSTNSSVSFEDSPISTSHVQTPSYTPINSPSIATSHNLSDQLPLVSHLKYVPGLLNLLNSNLPTVSNPNLAIQLPSIYPYLPKDADLDIADTLYSLYRVHINSLFEAMRFMHVRKLFNSFNNFNSTLTAPVFKLYTSDGTTEWIKQCDVIMYKRMIRMVSKLQFQFTIPVNVIQQLKQISAGYVKSLSSNLLNNKVSKSFVLMKLKLAKNFVNMLNRLVKTIETGISASRILSDPQEKHAMLQDWVNLDFNEIVQRELPCADQNINLLLLILRTDVVTLLNKGTDIMTELSTYIAELPGKFSDINPRLFILLSSNLMTTCLREISLRSGPGFGAWWIVRCWVDEFLCWCFELGGLFQTEFSVEEYNAPAQDSLPEVDLANVSASSSYMANNSLGLVDLLEKAYGLDATASATTNLVNPSANDMLLNYSTNAQGFH